MRGWQPIVHVSCLKLGRNDAMLCARLRGAITNHSHVTSVIDKCLAAASQEFVKHFCFFYAGGLLAQSDRVAEAIEVLQHGSRNIFCRVLLQHLQRHQSMAASVPDEVQGFDFWSRSRFAGWQRQKSLEAVKAFVQSGDKDTRTKTIVDLGVGNGVLLAQIVSGLIRANGFPALKLVIIDRHQVALDRAVKYLQSKLSRRVTLAPICARIEDLGEQEWKSFSAYGIWLTHAAAALHVLPRRKKLRILKLIGNVSQQCVITEIEGDHDYPRSGSLDLWYSVFRFYGGLIEDVLHSDLTKGEQDVSVRKFLLVEALEILTQNYTNRGNYHMLAEQWKVVFRQAGGRVNARLQEASWNGLRTMTMSIGFSP